MRRLLVTAVLISFALISSSCGAVPAPASPGPARQVSFVHRTTALQSLWRTDVADGVPAAAIAPLRLELSRSAFSGAPPSSSIWLTGDGHQLLDSLDARSAQAWTTAITGARQSAAAVMAAWSAMTAQYGASVAGSDAAASTWPSDLAGALTPAAITALVAGWSSILDSARSTAAAAAALTATLTPYGGIDGLEAAARSAIVSSSAHHLEAGSVPTSLTALQADVDSGGDLAAPVARLIGAVQSLRGVVATYLQEGARLAGLQQRVSEAGAMGTAHAPAFPAQYDAVVAAYRVATTFADVNAVGGRINGLYGAVNADLNAAADAARAAQLTSAGCGHAVPMGKVMVVSLGQQAAAFYDNGCLLSTTAVTTGRPGMRTPLGSFRIYSRASPAHFVSMYRPGSPGYYAPETTRFAMAYEGGGYYLHDAPWEPDSAFGPGGQNGPYASHGCIHVPTAVMAWLFGWASMGTRVIVTG